MIKFLRENPLYWLLLAMPVAVSLEWVHAEAIWLFVAAGTAIIPLAALMGRATESLAESLGAGIGGLLNATFGNAAELIIALIALWKGPEMYPLVRASITGSIIGNILLVLGLSLMLGGMRYPRQTFNRTAASLGATLLALAAVALIIPTLYFYVFTANPQGTELANIRTLSVEIAVVLAVLYALSLWFTLRTHSELYDGTAAAGHAPAAHAEAVWSRGRSVLVLLASTVGVAVMSEILVGSAETAGRAMGMSSVFVGVIVVAIIGNAAEHSSAVLVAMKNKVDLSVNIAVGSSIQIALFVAPVLVFVSLALGHPLDLHFTPMETISIVISVLVLAMICQDGESHWLEGVMLLAVYALLGLAFYHLPESVAALH